MNQFPEHSLDNNKETMSRNVLANLTSVALTHIVFWLGHFYLSFVFFLPAGVVLHSLEKTILVLFFGVSPLAVLSNWTGPSWHKRATETQLRGEVHYGQDLFRVQSACCSIKPSLTTEHSCYTVLKSMEVWNEKCEGILTETLKMLSKKRFGKIVKRLCHCDK